MASGEWNPTIEQGTQFKREITYKDEDGVVVNITGYKVRVFANVRKSSAVYIFDYNSDDDTEISVNAPTEGKFTIDIAGSVTADFDFYNAYLCLEITDGSNVKRLLEGEVTLSRRS